MLIVSRKKKKNNNNIRNERFVKSVFETQFQKFHIGIERIGSELSEMIARQSIEKQC